METTRHDVLIRDLQASTVPVSSHSLPADGTMPLLKGGVWTLAVGIASALSIRLFFGGISGHGPHTNMGWLMLIVAMMCLPFGLMIFLLGAAKWLRLRRLVRQSIQAPHSGRP